MRKYIQKNIKNLLLSILFVIVSSICAVRVQFLKGYLLDNALAGEFNATMRYGLILGLFIVLELGSYYIYDMNSSKFIVGSSKLLKNDFFYSLLNRSYPKYLDKNQGDYLALYTNNINIVERQYFSTIPLMGEVIFKIVVVSISLLILDVRIAIVTLVLLTMPLYIPKLIEKRLQKSQLAYTEEVEINLRKVTDWLKGFEIIKNYSIERAIQKKFEESNQLVADKDYINKQMGNISRSLSALLSYFSHFVILVYAAILVYKGDFSAGDFFVAIGMIDQLSYPIISVSRLVQNLISVKPVNDELLSFIRQSESGLIGMKEHIRELQEIEFDNVSFAYDGRKMIIEDFSYTFYKGEKYLMRGPSGSGKTTSMNLLLGYYIPNKGTVKINGIEAHQIANLNNIITIMRQDAILFDDSLRDNITMYQDIPDEKIIEVLKDIGLEKYANKNNLDMLINESGSNLSGGEKRRVSLARSIIRDSSILILDEPLANLDEKNMKSITDYLMSIEDKVLIIISHQFDSDWTDKLTGVVEL